MVRYFYSDGIQNHGPLTLEELKRKSIQPDTLIWHEGMSDWKRADRIDELREVIPLVPPPLPPRNNINEVADSYSDLDYEEVSDDGSHSVQGNDTRTENTDWTSFVGRIRRTEYGITLIVITVSVTILNLFFLDLEWYWLLFWHGFNIYIILAQGAKRCHDLGNSGWYQLIPFYTFWMLFAEGEKGRNYYGNDPKQ